MNAIPGHSDAAASGVTRRLASFVADLEFHQLPPPVIWKTKLCVLDNLGTVLAGLDSKVGQMAMRTASRFDSAPAASVFGTDRKLSPSAACLVNGTLAEVLELQDGWRFGNNHPCVVIPPAFAAAQVRGCDGQGFITAVVAGYEIANRLANAVHPFHLAKGFLPTGTAGTCGCAVAAAKVLGFDADRIANAIGISAYLFPVSTAENLWEGYSAKALHSGWAGKAGFESALLAGEGFDACPVEGSPSRGRGALEITTGEVNFERALAGIGNSYTVDDVYFKIYPACRHAHGAAEAALNVSAMKPRLEAITEIRVFTYDLAARLLNRYTNVGSSIVAAQFSIPYVVAAALADHELGIRQFQASRIADPKIHQFASRIGVSSDARLTGLYPEVTPTRVEVTLSEGTVLKSEVKMPRGDPRTALDDDVLFNKFNDLASTRLSDQETDTLRELVMNLEQLPDLDDIFRLASRGHRTDG